MNAIAALAIALAFLAFQLGPGDGLAQQPDPRSCADAQRVAATPPPDFLFATAHEWKRYALEAGFDVRH